jgi:hypothetical protein
MTPAAPLFEAYFDGEPPQAFLTLQAAMFWAEHLDRPTGTIRFERQAIVRYANGDVSLAR